MASFKEIKERIVSVKNTRKITAAMKMVSAAKLNKAQKNIVSMLPYSNALHHILSNTLASAEGSFNMPLAVQRTTERVAIVVFSSDSSLAGAFNSNVIKTLRKALNDYVQLPKENIFIYTIGKKVFDAVKKSDYFVTHNFEGLAAKPEYGIIAAFATKLIEEFLSKAIDRIEVIYHHFKSAGSQTLIRECFLPLTLPDDVKTVSAKMSADYIFEPSSADILTELLPKTLKLKLYTILLDSNASEHAARVVAMQVATDNADELVDELTIAYNKSRQQTITNELLDIAGGALLY